MFLLKFLDPPLNTSPVPLEILKYAGIWYRVLQTLSGLSSLCQCCDILFNPIPFCKSLDMPLPLSRIKMPLKTRPYLAQWNWIQWEDIWNASTWITTSMYLWLVVIPIQISPSSKAAAFQKIKSLLRQRICL